MVDRLNRTLKTMLQKHAAMFGEQWNQFLPEVLWACRIIPHKATKEKPSFILFGIDLKPGESAAHVMRDICGLLGVTKLNTTSYHPQCDRMVECLNRTLKTMLAAKFGEHVSCQGFFGPTVTLPMRDKGETIIHSLWHLIKRSFLATP